MILIVSKAHALIDLHAIGGAAAASVVSTVCVYTAYANNCYQILPLSSCQPDQQQCQLAKNRTQTQ